MALARAVLLGSLFLAFGLVKNGCDAWAGEPPEVVDINRSLAPGDIVTLEILEDKAPPIVRTVTDTGELDVPLLHRIPVAGKTCKQVAIEITRKLEADYYEKTTVKLGLDKINRSKAGDASVVYVLGQVKAPGAQQILPGNKLTVSGAIVKAGGGTQFANLRKVKLTRKNKDGTGKTIIVDIKAIIEEGKMEKDIEVEDGDYIFMPQRLFNFQ